MFVVVEGVGGQVGGLPGVLNGAGGRWRPLLVQAGKHGVDQLVQLAQTQVRQTQLLQAQAGLCV